MAKVIDVVKTVSAITVVFSDVEINTIVKVLGKESYSSALEDAKCTEKEATALQGIYDELEKAKRDNNI